MNIIQGSPEWLAMRKDHIGASDAPVIMQVSPFCTQYQLWTYKMGLAEPKMNSAMQRGVDMEEEARQMFNSIYETDTKATVYIDDVYPWMMASFDGVSSDKKTVVEIKCPGQKDHDISKVGAVPEKYWPQLQHQLYISKLDELSYFSYRSSDDYVRIIVKRDNSYIDKMIEDEKEFYRSMVEFDPPTLCDADYADLSTNEEWCKAALQYRIASEEKRKWVEAEDLARENLLSLSGGKSCTGSGLRCTKYFRKGAVEYFKIPELKKVDVEKYRKPCVVSYRFTIGG